MGSLPDSLKVGAHVLAIARIDTGNISNSTATIDLKTGEISIDDKLSESVAWDAVIHEVIEFVNCVHNLDLRHEQITTIGICVHQFIVDNKEELGKI